jgi:uncharacterized membrane protein YdjX (TVP38/TMEM64 family)
MAVWDRARRQGWSGRAVLALGVLAVLLVLAVPAAFFVGVLMMLLGHVVGGLALFGGSIIAAGAAVIIAGWSGVRHVRRLVSRERFRVVQLGSGDYRFD